MLLLPNLDNCMWVILRSSPLVFIILLNIFICFYKQSRWSSKNRVMDRKLNDTRFLATPGPLQLNHVAGWLKLYLIPVVNDSDIYIYISLSICCTRTGQLYINPNDLETLASVLSSISWRRRHWGPGPFQELRKGCQGTCEQCCSCSWSQHSRGSKTTLHIDENYAYFLCTSYVSYICA